MQITVSANTGEELKGLEKPILLALVETHVQLQRLGAMVQNLIALQDRSGAGASLATAPTTDREVYESAITLVTKQFPNMRFQILE